MEADWELTTVPPEYNNSSYDFVTTGNSTVNTAWWQLLTNGKHFRHSAVWTYTMIVVYCLVFIVGCIGNTMVILVVVLRPQMRTVTNMFIMNLAVADLFVILFCLPATLLSNLFKPWLLGPVMCKGVGYVQGVSVWASAYSIAAISLDRCIAIYRPMELARGFTKSQALATICLIWVFGLLVTLPWAVIFDVIAPQSDFITYCVENWENEIHGKMYFLLVNLFLCYIIPLIIVTISNLVIWCHVSQRNLPQGSDLTGNIKQMHRRTRQGVRKMLACVTLIFLISWLPLYVIVTRLKFADVNEGERNVLEILLPFAQWLGGWNSCINPVLYAFLNSKFREMFLSLLPTWCQCLHREPCSRTNVNSRAGMNTFANVSIGKTCRLDSHCGTATNLSQRRNATGSFQELEDQTTTFSQQSCRKRDLAQNLTNVSSQPVAHEKLKQNTVILVQPTVIPKQGCVETDV